MGAAWMEHLRTVDRILPMVLRTMLWLEWTQPMFDPLRPKSVTPDLQRAL